MGWKREYKPFPFSALPFSLAHLGSAVINLGWNQLKFHFARTVFLHRRGGTEKSPPNKRVFPTLPGLFLVQAPPLRVNSQGPFRAARDGRDLTSRPLSDRTRTDCAPKYFSKSSFSSAVSSAGRCLTRRVRSPRGRERAAEPWHPLGIGSGCSGAAISLGETGTETSGEEAEVKKNSVNQQKLR